MSQMSKQLAICTLLVATASTYYASRARLIYQQRLDARRYRVDIPIPKKLKIRTPEFRITSDTKVKVTPIEPGILVGMAEDGTYLAYDNQSVDEFRKRKATSDQPNQTGWPITLFVRYPDKSRTSFEVPSDATVRLFANSDVLIIREPLRVDKQLEILKKGSKEPIEVKDTYKSRSGFEETVARELDDFILSSNGRYIPLKVDQTRSGQWYDLETKSLGGRERSGPYRLNALGKIVNAGDSEVRVGDLVNQKAFITPENLNPMTLVSISHGENPRGIVSYRHLYSRQRLYFEVLPHGLSLIPTFDDTQFYGFHRISKEGNMIVTNEDGNVFLRWNGEWSDISSCGAVHHFDTPVEKLRTATYNAFGFEDGKTLITKIIDGKNYICKLEVIP